MRSHRDNRDIRGTLEITEISVRYHRDNEDNSEISSR